MHKFAEEIMECLKAKVKATGIDNIEGGNLEEVKTWSEIAKNIVCYDKDYKIIEAMEDAENEDIVDMYGLSEIPYEARKHYPRMRDSRGRFMSRRNYPNYRMTPEMYNMDYDDLMYYGNRRNYGGNHGGYYGNRRGYDEMRDMDIDDGRMYGADEMHTDKDGRSWVQRRTYMESKEMGKDKQTKMNELSKYLEELKSDMVEMVDGMSSEEKQMLKSKMTSIASTL